MEYCEIHPHEIMIDGEHCRDCVAQLKRQAALAGELVNALQIIADDEGEPCPRCEGSGSLWADGRPHSQSYEGPTRPCPNCFGAGRIYHVKLIAEAALAKWEAAKKLGEK